MISALSAQTLGRQEFLCFTQGHSGRQRLFVLTEMHEVKARTLRRSLRILPKKCQRAILCLRQVCINKPLPLLLCPIPTKPKHSHREQNLKLGRFLTIGLRPGGRFENDYQCDLDVLPCLTIITFSLALVLLKLDDCCALVTTSKLVAISRMRHLLSDMLVTFDTSLIGSP